MVFYLDRSPWKTRKEEGVGPKIVYQPEEMLSKLLQLPGGNQINMYCQVK